MGVYIHIPFCKQKCVYCDFLSFECEDVQATDRYVEALLCETEAKGKEYPGYKVDTVFIGGGTPSILPADQIGRMMAKVRDIFAVCEDAEITIETNPGTLTVAKLAAYRAAGINRLSMGVQSFDDEILKRIGRIHTEEEARQSFHAARKAGFDNINIDLMFSVPGHSREKWHKTLQQAIAVNPEHISFYSLQLEEGTPLFRAFERGEFKPTSDEEDRVMYHEAIKSFEEAGYEHYEISNVAKPGRESRHNLKYWSMQDYLGIGIGAHSFLDGIRFSNTADMGKYIAAAGQCAYDTYKVNSKRDNAGEFVFTGLRKMKGIALDEFAARFEASFFDFYRAETDEIKEYIENGFLSINDGKLSLTEKGIDISNEIMAVFV